MKKLLPLLVASMLATLVRAEPLFIKPEGWALGTVFPGEPKQSESREPKPEGDIVQSQLTYESGSVAYGVTRIHHPVPIPKGRIPAAYDGARNGMLRTMGGTLISEKQIEILGREARRYIISVKDDAYTCELRLLIIGDALYLFMHLRPREELSPAEAAAFFDNISDAEMN